ncbi:MAG: hypothetical protein QX203_13845, partial [Methylococcaceae bacterium]
TPVFKEAFEIATQSIWNKNELEVYEYQQMQRMIRESAEATAKNEGWQKGLQEGLQEGRQEGWQEAQKTIARNLLDLLDDATIAQKTGLTPEQIKRLRS